MKETHFCAFNDGRENCVCYLDALRDLRQLLQTKVKECEKII